MSAPLLPTREQLLAVCGSTAWVGYVAEQAPFADVSALHAAADAAFDELSEEDWLEAFAHHPRIGDVSALRERFAASGALSEREQAGIDGAADDVVTQLAAGNEAYEQRFGFVFLVRAAGRSAQDMLAMQQERLGNERSVELRIAAQQQREITHLRIDQTIAAEGD